MLITLVDSSRRKRDIWQVIDGVQQEALRTIPESQAGHQGMGADVWPPARPSGHPVRAGPRAAVGDGRGAPALGGDPGLLPGDDLLGPEPASAPCVRGSRPGPGDRPDGERGDGPGLLRAQGRSHQRVLPARQHAAVHHSGEISRRSAARPDGPRAGEDRRQEGRGDAAPLGGPGGGESGAHAHRARQLTPRGLGARLLPGVPSMELSMDLSWPLTRSSTSPPDTAWSCAGT
jgi:hypothetical protein